MHEMAVTESLLRLATREAQQAGAAKITRITLVIGELSSIIDESVGQYFAFLSEGTIAAGAELVFKRIPATLQCTQCGRQFPKERGRFTCPHCSGMSRLIGDAKDFYIESLEVD